MGARGAQKRSCVCTSLPKCAPEHQVYLDGKHGRASDSSSLVPDDKHPRSAGDRSPPCTSSATTAHWAGLCSGACPSTGRPGTGASAPIPGIHKGMHRHGQHQVGAQAPAVRKPIATQDGYAVCSSDGPGEYTVEFEALAGTAPGRLSVGLVAYIGTGMSTLVC